MDVNKEYRIFFNCSENFITLEFQQLLDEVFFQNLFFTVDLYCVSVSTSFSMWSIKKTAKHLSFKTERDVFWVPMNKKAAGTEFLLN